MIARLTANQTETNMTINASLERLVLATPQVASMADYYAKAFGYSIQRFGSDTRCEAPGRSLWLREGAANDLLESHFLMPDVASFDALAQRLLTAGLPIQRDAEAAAPALWVSDPDGRRLRFRVGAVAAGANGTTLAARIQHYAVRSQSPQALADFYVHKLGFTPSDWVRDDTGNLTAAFLRTDAEHHVLAIFRAPQACFDHFAHETHDWTSLRDWADYMSKQGVLLAWGVGRHGPGNDVFFMVKDPDGNMAEISAELEVCAENRPAGEWPHSPQTLNVWGQAIMRS